MNVDHARPESNETNQHQQRLHPCRLQLQVAQSVDRSKHKRVGLTRNVAECAMKHGGFLFPLVLSSFGHQRMSRTFLVVSSCTMDLYIKPTILVTTRQSSCPHRTTYCLTFLHFEPYHCFGYLILGLPEMLSSWLDCSSRWKCCRSRPLTIESFRHV